ncbi:MAG: tetratricopeptide repeat protein, partial [Candidatus Eremiobacterota bacterium]
MFAQGPVFAAHPLGPVADFCNRSPRGILLLEAHPEAGADVLLASLDSPSSDLGLPLLRYPFPARPESDGGTLLEHLTDWLRLHPPTPIPAFRTPEFPVLRDLNMRYPQCGERLGAYLNTLSTLNGKHLVLSLESLGELSELAALTLSDFLADDLPGGLFLVLSCWPPGVAAGLGRRLGELSGSPLCMRVALEPSDPIYSHWVKAWVGDRFPALGPDQVSTVLARSGGYLKPALWMGEVLAAGIYSSPEELPSRTDSDGWFFASFVQALKLRWAEKAAAVEHCLVALAAASPSSPIHELFECEVESVVLTWVLRSCPSLFHRAGRGDDLTVGLVEPAFSRFMRGHPGYPAMCDRLAERAFERLSRQSGTTGVGDFLRLYRWVCQGSDAAMMERVARSRPLNDLRIGVSSRLELQDRYHLKVELLDCWQVVLARLVSRCPDLREELAWAHNSRGLTYLSLGQFRRGLSDIDAAIGWFRTLVELERQTDLANGLAAALNRRSEALRQLNEFPAALAEAEKAVALYQSVVDHGRSDLTSLLALAHQNRALILRYLGQLQQAERDCERAIALYASQGERRNALRVRRDLAMAYHTRASLELGKGDLNAAL